MQEDTSEGSAETLRVLVADDDPIVRSLIGARLSQLNGIAVEAADGADAWKLLTAQSFDLAIVDLGMPNIDGFELIRCMRDHPRARHLPIVVVTSRFDREALDGAMTCGATSFLTKPLHWGTFEHHLGYLLRQANVARALRAQAQRASAAARATEAVLGNMCCEAQNSTAIILDEVQSIWSKLDPAARDGLPVDSLARIARAASGLHQSARKSTSLVSLFAEKIVVDNRRILLSALLAQARLTMQPFAATSGVTLEVQAPVKDVQVCCDAGAVELALGQLIQNALAYSPEGTRVTVRSHLFPDGMLAIDVEDDGPGMHPEFVARCLTPLRAELSHRSGSSPVGFGLPAAKAIAEAHHGSLEIRSMPGQGTTVHFILPAERVITTPRLYVAAH